MNYSRTALAGSFFALAMTVATGMAQAASATLPGLLSGGSLTEMDIVFDNFGFEDNSDIATYPNDTEVNPAWITMSTASTSNSVTIMAEISPGLSISNPDGFFEFLLDFNVTSTAGRSIVEVILGGGDLFATGFGLTEMEYDVEDGLTALGDVEIFEDPSASQPADRSQTSDSLAGLGASALALFGQIEGEAEDPGDTAGLSTYSLTFVLDRDLTPVEVVPVPASALLLLGGLSGFGLVAHRRKS